MKPITILIPLLALLCGCDEKARPVTREEFIAFKIRMQNELYDINMRLHALERVTFTNDIPPGTIWIPGGEHVLSAPILIKKRIQP